MATTATLVFECTWKQIQAFILLCYNPFHEAEKNNFKYSDYTRIEGKIFKIAATATSDDKQI